MLSKQLDDSIALSDIIDDSNLVQLDIHRDEEEEIPRDSVFGAAARRAVVNHERDNWNTEWRQRTRGRPGPSIEERDVDADDAWGTKLRRCVVAQEESTPFFLLS